MYITKEQAIKQGVGRNFGVCRFHENHPNQKGIRNCPNCRIIIDPCGCDAGMGCSRCETKLVRKFLKEMNEDSFNMAVLTFKWEREKKEILCNYSHSDHWFDRQNKQRNKRVHGGNHGC